MLHNIVAFLLALAFVAVFLGVVLAIAVVLGRRTV